MESQCVYSILGTKVYSNQVENTVLLYLLIIRYHPFRDTPVFLLYIPGTVRLTKLFIITNVPSQHPNYSNRNSYNSSREPDPLILSCKNLASPPP